MMNFRISAVVVIVCGLQITRVSSEQFGFEEAQRKKILHDHNQIRKSVEPKPSDMMMMKWWVHGASKAYDVALSCNERKDDDINMYGQTLFVSNNASFQPANVVDELQKQKSSYILLSNACVLSTVCEGYRQMIWATSTKVGCAYNNCTKFRDKYGKEQHNITYVVCVYDKKASTKLQVIPYSRGSPCTECDSSLGTWCQDGLCTDKCVDIANCTAANETSCQTDELRGKCPVKCKECGCRLQCFNCAVLDHSKCTCLCDAGFYGDRCENRCSDAASGCDTADIPKCNTSPRLKQKCPEMCDVCVFSGKSECKSVVMPKRQPKKERFVDTDRYIDCQAEMPCRSGMPYLERRTCKCRCSPGWQGTYCDKTIEDARSGVVLLIDGEKNRYSEITKKLRSMIADKINEYCRSNFEECCPYEEPRGEIPSGMHYTDYHRIKIGIGYPDFAALDRTFEVLFYVIYKRSNNLCNQNADLARLKRDLTSGCAVGYKREGNKCIYNTRVPREIVFNSMRNDLDTMNRRMCCRASIRDVDFAAVNVKPYTNHRAGVKMDFYDWERALIVLGVLFASIMVFLIMWLFFRQSRDSTRARAEAKKSSTPAVKYGDLRDDAGKPNIDKELQEPPKGQGHINPAWSETGASQSDVGGPSLERERCEPRYERRYEQTNYPQQRRQDRTRSIDSFDQPYYESGL